MKQAIDLSNLADVLTGLSHMLDSGKHDGITVEDVKKASASGKLTSFLKEQNKREFGYGVFDRDKDFSAWYETNIADHCKNMNGREIRKFDIKNRGICLLITYTAELIKPENP